MRGSRLAAMGAFVVAALTLGACASAASPPARQASASAAPTATDTAHLTDYAANTDGPKSTVILTGAIGDYGRATSIHPDGTADPGHTSQLELTLTRGTFRIIIGGLHAKLVNAFGQFPANARTCSGTVTAAAAAPIVAGSGTGAYTHVSGSFNLTATVDEVDTKPICDGSGAFRAQTIVITGYGTVLPG